MLMTGETRVTERRLRSGGAGPPLADITKNGTPGARVSAAVVLLDRAYGKAPTFSTSDTQAFKRAIDMTDDELAAIASGARLTLVNISILSPLSFCLNMCTYWGQGLRHAFLRPRSCLRMAVSNSLRQGSFAARLNHKC